VATRKALVKDGLAEGQLVLADLLGPVHPLEEFASVFEQARCSESARFFSAP
jgi:hypothetical protein